MTFRVPPAYQRVRVFCVLGQPGVGELGIGLLDGGVKRRFRLSRDDARFLLDSLAERLGVTVTDAIPSDREAARDPDACPR